MCGREPSISFHLEDVKTAEYRVYEAVSQLVVQRFNEPDSESDKGEHNLLTENT